MATTDENDERVLQNFHLRQRRALNNAYAALIARQNTNTFAAFTFEEAVDLQIERIEGAGTQLRPNLLGRVDRIENELLQTVEELKKLPPDRFLEKSPDEDVNTPENPEE